MMKHDDLVFETLAYRRNVGADLKSIRSRVSGADKKPSMKEIRAALGRLSEAEKAFQVGEKWFLTSQGLKLARGWALRPEWLLEDSWILLALFYGGGRKGCDLRAIIGAADYIDHAIPTTAEMHGALNRLAAGGLVKTRKGLFLVTDKAIAIYDKVQAECGRGTGNQRDGLRRILDCPCCGVELKKVRWKIRIDDAAMKEAYQRYIRKS